MANTKDLLMDKLEFANKEIMIEEPESEEEYFYCKFCGVTKVELCRCNSSENQYSGEE